MQKKLVKECELTQFNFNGKFRKQNLLRQFKTTPKQQNQKFQISNLKFT